MLLNNSYKQRNSSCDIFERILQGIKHDGDIENLIEVPFSDFEKISIKKKGAWRIEINAKKTLLGEINTTLKNVEIDLKNIIDHLDHLPSNPDHLPLEIDRIKLGIEAVRLKDSLIKKEKEIILYS